MQRTTAVSRDALHLRRIGGDEGVVRVWAPGRESFDIVHRLLLTTIALHDVSFGLLSADACTRRPAYLQVEGLDGEPQVQVNNKYLSRLMSRLIACLSPESGETP